MGVLAGEAADLGVVVAESVVMQPRLGIAVLALEAQVLGAAARLGVELGLAVPFLQGEVAPGPVAGAPDQLAVMRRQLLRGAVHVRMVVPDLGRGDCLLEDRVLGAGDVAVRVLVDRRHTGGTAELLDQPHAVPDEPVGGCRPAAIAARVMASGLAGIEAALGDAAAERVVVIAPGPGAVRPGADQLVLAVPGQSEALARFRLLGDQPAVAVKFQIFLLKKL